MKSYIFAALAAALMLSPVVVEAASVRTETVVRPIPNARPDTLTVDFAAFDRNGDGNLATTEVGEHLFSVFDPDGNHLIDNIEYDKKRVYTFTPMERVTLQYVDTNSDGMVEQSTHSREEFMKASGLSRFDENRDGLSPADFAAQPFKTVDRDNSGLIDMKEWKEAYGALVKPLPHNDTFRYND